MQMKSAQYAECIHISHLMPSSSPKAMSRMRLQAAASLLHMSAIGVYADALIPKFLRLAVVVQVSIPRRKRIFTYTLQQDSCYNVRISFLSKLISRLQSRKLPPRYNVILFLTIHDPEEDVKTKVSCVLPGSDIGNWVIRLHRMCKPL
jgi:sister chromatid cohesion protein PDS5